MNNCMDRNFNNTARVNLREYNEAFGERIIAFFCLIIAFFENSVVDAVCRVAGGCALAVGVFFYASSVMGGTASAAEVILYGALLVASSALVFRSSAKRSE